MEIKNRARRLFIGIYVLITFSIACGSVQVGMVTPNSENGLDPVVEVQKSTSEVVPVIVDEARPTEEPPEDFSHLWVEYWNPVHNYGIALPNHWIVNTESEGGFMSTRSYDMDYFNANSIKGNWIGGNAPEGAVKLDFAPIGGILPEQTLEVAISNLLGEDQDVSVLLSVEKVSIGNNDAVVVTTAPPHNLEDKTTSIAIRLSPDTILAVAAFPNAALYSSDVKLILSSLVPDKSTPIIKPYQAPHPPLTVKSEVSGLPTATPATAWYGHIASLTGGEPYDDKVVLLPLGTGDFGIKGATPEIEAKIQSLRDASAEAEYVHLWGTLYCNVDDYNTCQLNVERLEYGDQYTVAMSPIDKWVGTIKSTTYDGNPTHIFELSNGVPVWYGITANNDQLIQDQIEGLSDSGTIVSVWGDLLVGVQDVNNTRIDVRSLDPPGPGALPSSAVCEPGYLSSVEEMLEVLQYNLEIGNYYPFSYMIGNPFVIGYWQSEGVSLPREEAFVQLQNSYFPSPEAVTFTSDPNQFPDLGGIPLDTMWGPDVDVAANLYSQGWGSDGTGEAILVIARCSSSGYDQYYWYGMLYAMNGFE